MSLSKCNFSIAPEKNSNLKQSKSKKIKPSFYSRMSGGTPWCTSQRKATYTIEATVVLPLFIMMMVFIMFFSRIMEVEAGVQQAMDESSRLAAVVSKKDDTSLAKLVAATDALIKKNGVPTDYIEGGMLGINYLNSKVDENYVDLRAEYVISFPIRMFGRLDYKIVQTSRNRKWVGYDPNEMAWDGVYVFITETGTVYHTTESCTYLNPSIKSVNVKDIEHLRNEGGAKYWPCEVCKPSKSGNETVYITDYGTVYHDSVQCSSLKRTIRKVLLDDVKDTHRPCSKCGS